MASVIVDLLLFELIVLCAATTPAFAAHPLQTEDTGTQGRGRFEIENGLSWTRTADSRLFLVQPQLSYGALPSLDLIFQPSWQVSQAQGPDSARGLGDTNIDAKWRFFGAAHWSAGVRFGVTAATNQHGFGQPHGTLGSHALLVATATAAPLTFHLNAGLGHQPGGPGERTRIAQLSAAAMWAVNGRLTLAVDAGAQSNRDQASGTWPGYGLVGAIYTLRPGLDADVGYLKSVHAATSTRVWLLGLTYRFAL